MPSRPDPPLSTRPDFDPSRPALADDEPPPADGGGVSDSGNGLTDAGTVTTTGTFPAGRMVGRYRVSRRLGSGGFARVYSALDPDLELEVALKILRPELAADPDTVERFRREATTAAKLRHPNVITVLTVGRLEEAFDGAAPGTPYLVMDLLPDSLADRIAGGGTLPSDEVARIGAEVARGLAFAHRHGIVHRDVKPENVLFARDGRAVVTDFGIARAVAGSPTATSRQVVLGTPTYFSPEQARGLPLDGRSDIYALGVTLFRAVTGVLPFPGEDWYEVMRAHVEAAPPRVRNLATGVAPGLDAAIARSLAKRPDDRFATADELAVALDTARGGRPSASATVVVPRPVGAARRRSRLAAWAAGVAVLGTAGAVAAYQRTRGGGEAPSAATARPAFSPADTARLPLTALAPPGVAPTGALRDSSPTGSGSRRDSAISRPAGDSAPARPASASPADTSRRRAASDSARQAARTQAPALAVTAPDQAEIFVDGQRVARGSTRRDGLRPGRHVIRARVQDLPGCASATIDTSVTLAPGARQQLALEPVGCGSLSFDIQPNAARYRLTSVASGRVFEGELPLSQPLLLPEDRYVLTVEAVQCAPFTDTVTVVARRTRTEPAKLLCN